MGGVCASLCSRAFELGFGSPASQPPGRELLVWIPQRPDAQPGTSDPVRHSPLDSGEPDTTQERRNPGGAGGRVRRPPPDDNQADLSSPPSTDGVSERGREALQQPIVGRSACDFFTVNTIWLRRLRGWFFIELGPRR